MKKIFFAIFFVLFVFLLFKPDSTAIATDNCDGTYKDKNDNPITTTIVKNSDQLKYEFRLPNPNPNAKYTVKICNKATIPGCSKIDNLTPQPNGILTGPPLTIYDLGTFTDGLEITVDTERSVVHPICYDSFLWSDAPTPTPARKINCFLDLKPPRNITALDTLTLIGQLKDPVGMKNYGLVDNISNLDYCSRFNCQTTHIHLTGETINGEKIERDFYPQLNVDINGQRDTSSFITDLQENYDKGKYKVTAYINVKDTDTLLEFASSSCSLDFTVPGGIVPTPTITPTPTIASPAFCGFPPCDNGSCSDRCNQCPGCPGSKPKPTPKIAIPNLKPLCDQLSAENNYRDECWKCQKSGGIWSAIGCLPTDFSALIKDKVFPVGLGIAGGVAFLYFLYGAFMILTSSGNAETIEEAKQIITSALAGLLLIIFSIFILKVIGVDILQLPGFK